MHAARLVRVVGERLAGDGGGFGEGPVAEDVVEVGVREKQVQVAAGADRAHMPRDLLHLLRQPGGVDDQDEAVALDDGGVRLEERALEDGELILLE